MCENLSLFYFGEVTVKGYLIVLLKFIFLTITKKGKCVMAIVEVVIVLGVVKLS